MTKINKKLLFVLAILVGAPLVLHLWLSRKDKHYDELIKRYECEPGVCEADFNRDGRVERLERVKRSSTSTDELLVVTDGKQELLNLPYDYIDGTLRTHVAIRTENGNPTLIVFDGTKGGEPYRAAFGWSGTKIVEIVPSAEDLKILSAMAARDNAGHWTNWGLYRAFSLPLLLAYYSLLVLTVAVFILSRWLGARRTKNHALR